MKPWLVLLALATLPAHAFLNEVECHGRRTSSLEIERPFGNVRDARAVRNGTTSRYRVWQVRTLPGRMYYSGDNGFRLDIDLFPGNQPQWGRTYRARFEERGYAPDTLNCRFPLARP